MSNEPIEKRLLREMSKRGPTTWKIEAVERIEALKAEVERLTEELRIACRLEP